MTHTDTWWLSLSTQQGGSAVSTLDGDTTEMKQKQQYMGKYKRPDISGRKFEPTFIFKKSLIFTSVLVLFFFIYSKT